MKIMQLFKSLFKLKMSVCLSCFLNLCAFISLQVYPPLNPSGPKTKITPQERIAAKRLVLVIRHGTNWDNILKWTFY
jgi:hypothetical protein